MIVRKPALRNGRWCVVIAEDHSPFAKQIEAISHSSLESAYQTYREIKKELGQGL